jgi:methylmalonyl-CoA mutase N-terminal domain/subunit
MQEKRIRSIREYKKSRNGDQVRRALDNLTRQVKERKKENILPILIETVEQKVTSGEMSDALREAYDFRIPTN